MNAERYFPEVEFNNPTFLIHKGDKRDFGSELDLDTPRILYQSICDSIDPWVFGDLFDIDSRHLPTTETGAIQTLRSLLIKIEAEEGVELPIHDREIIFVSPDMLKPSNEKTRKMLIKKYGSNLSDGSGGQCAKKPNGGYLLSISNDIWSYEYLEVIAHEYGHSLGDVFLSSPIAEEMKAYAFTSLVMQNYFEVDEYHPEGFMPDQTHDIASDRVRQLIEKGVKPLAIISHLINHPFGSQQPSDYRKHI